MDERRHTPGPERGWEESWSFDFVATDGTVAGFVRLALHPAPGSAWYWAYLVRPGMAVVVVRDHEVDAPRGRDLEVRGDGLWAQVICETPFEHWSAGLEAFAVAIDDPTRAWGDERGDPVALGLDLEWEMRAPPHPFAPAGYTQPAAVHGEVLVGAERLTLGGSGWYSHAWGPPGWQDPQWWAVTACFEDGTAVASRCPGRASTWPSGDTSPAPVPMGFAASLVTRWRHDRLPESADLVVGDRQIRVSPLGVAPVPLDVEGRRDRVLVRALCSFSEGANRGWGWSEWLQPPTSSSPSPHRPIGGERGPAG